MSAQLRSRSGQSNALVAVHCSSGAQLEWLFVNLLLQLPVQLTGEILRQFKLKLRSSAFISSSLLLLGVSAAQLLLNLPRSDIV